MLKLMAGQGPMAIREIARRGDRDVRAVHSDVHVLMTAGLVERTDNGRVQFPYDAIHVNFVLSTAAQYQPRRTFAIGQWASTDFPDTDITGDVSGHWQNDIVGASGCEAPQSSTPDRPLTSL
jgi:hypothetical protein